LIRPTLFKPTCLALGVKIARNLLILAGIVTALVDPVRRSGQGCHEGGCGD
jgi:hypothetical protein